MKHGDYSAFVMMVVDEEGVLYVDADLRRINTGAGASALGGSFRATRARSNLRILTGTHYKKWLSGQKLMLMAELDGAFQRFEDATNYTRFQMAAHAGPVWFPTKGVSASVAYELFDEDVRVKRVERQSLTSWISYLPRAHFEVFALGRAERIGPRNRVYFAMLQLHYYL